MPRTSAIAVLLMSLSALVPGMALAQGASVVVLRTSEMGAYKAVEASFTAALGPGQSIASIGLAAPDAKERFEQAKPGAKLIVALGPEAARLAATATGTKTVSTLLSAEADKDAVVLPMFVAPARQVRTLKTVLPAAQTVGMVYDPKVSKALVAGCEAAAAAEGLKLVRAEVGSRAEVAEAARSLVGKVDALWLVPDPTVISADTFKLLLQISLAAKMPVMGFTSGMAKAGALVSLEATHEELGQHVAEAARRILAGQAAALEGCEGTLYLNAKVAELLGVALPDEVKGKAATVF
ncbi:MAG: ABC transporter substrate binding protein [Myxococcales bacterium]